MSFKCLLSLHLLIFFFLMRSSFSTAATDTISRGQFIAGNRTLVSKGGKFELGFFTPGRGNYYIGIWYRNIPQQTVIWVANRRAPVSDALTTRLELAENGNLVVLASGLKTPIWSTNSTSTSNSSEVVANLVNTGNLVLTSSSNSSVIIWQSFDHPTDTWIPGGWIGMNKVTGEYQSIVSWKSPEDPSPGLFSSSIDPDGTNQFLLLWNNSKAYWNSGVWDGKSFSRVPGMRAAGSLYIYKFVDDNRRRYFTTNLSDTSILYRNVMSPSGQVQQWMWFHSTGNWVLVWTEPDSLCDIYSVCGAFGVCDSTLTPVCSCPLGFDPVSPGDWELGAWSSGCTRRTGLKCNSSGQGDGFVAMPNMRLPVDSMPLTTVSSGTECEATCLSDCSCTAYSYGTGCLVWKGDVRNLERVSSDGNGVGTIHLRLAAADLPGEGSKKKLILLASLLVTVVMASLAIAAFAWISYKRSGQRRTQPVEGPLVSFTYRDIQRATKNFSDKLGGGGFGPVFKGLLPDSTVVAVKRLVGVTQGEKQFRSELATLGMVQHVNLVRLRGFCSEGSERILVYDYMPRGSLNRFLFPHRGADEALDWRTRYRIIMGVARGLAYLHDECRERIIHCDIKPENVLLDSEFHPKVADFGMAKLVGRDISRVLTTMRGTIGYLAPEWISGVAITAKADVFSFGMMAFEVVSGRRNSEIGEDGKISFFPIKAAAGVIRGEVASLLDEDLHGCADVSEIEKVCRVACWCIQDSEEERPSMGIVVKMLEGVLDVKMPPLPRALHHLSGHENVGMLPVC